MARALHSRLGKSMRNIRSGILVLLAGCVLVKGQDAPASKLPAGYAGSEACGLCHEDISKAFASTPHHGLDTNKKRGFEGRSCEACHGPAQKHTESASAEDIRNPGKLAAAAADKICMSCHLNEPTHVGRLQSSHAKDQVSCTSCHKVHAEGGKQLVQRGAQAINAQCASCHTNAWAQFQKPFHHRLPEGGMSCVDCHNPHGTTRPGNTNFFAANEPGCFSCHGDKRGPFMYEHAPVRFEACSTCHETHGSTNPRMLVRQEVRLVCLECHSNLPTVKTGALGTVPPAFHDLRSPRFQNCTVCHQKIHGSHVDRNLLK